MQKQEHPLDEILSVDFSDPGVIVAFWKFLFDKTWPVLALAGLFYLILR